MKSSIIWFTGQPFSGKTTLANVLAEVLKPRRCFIVDGDIIRKLYGNQDYSIEGRKRNIELAQKITLDELNRNDHVIAALVSPFKMQREDFKQKNLVKEIYLKSNRERFGKMVDYYEPPEKDFLYIDTDKITIEDSIDLILKYINK